MSPERDESRRADPALTGAVWAALLASLLPVLPVVTPGAWVGGAALLSAAVLFAGYLARRRRMAAIAVTLIEVALWTLFMTVVFLRSTALLGLIPTPETVLAVPGILGEAMQEITVGAAPLEATASLSFLIVGATGLLAIVIDHVVLTARMPLLASVGIIAVSLIPAIAVPRDVDVMAFVLLAVAILFLVRTETRSREDAASRTRSRAAGVPATAVGIGAIAVVVTLVAAPLLPSPVARAGSGVLAGPGIDASLQLGDDLRRPQEIEVLRMHSDSPTTPYLRATTLTRFDGAVWLPDRVRTVPLDSDQGLGELAIDPDVRTTEYTTSVDIVNLSSIWLPISYPAVEVSGLQGRWAAVPYNRTVISQSGTTQGQSYEVRTLVPRPTLEQIRATEATTSDVRDETLQLPEDLPPVIAEKAITVTAGTTTDYDAALALQRWFRSGEFRYSLSAPVEDDFDGSGAEAVAKFLDVREGYCIHFASAFALMARTLGMPTRIVVGYLPGIATQDTIDDEVVYTVPSSLLHAWPEVYFRGIGWVGFEPTNGLGTPTAFFPAAVAPGQIGDPGDPRTQPSASASPTASPSTLNPRDSNGEAGGGTVVRPLDAMPAVGAIAAILAVLALPALVREVRRRRLLTAARAGDVSAGWASVQDAAIDLGIPVPGSESPRAFAARLAAEYGGDQEALSVLVEAIERVSYAPARVAAYWQGDEVADAAAAVRRSLALAAPQAARAASLVMPRSLVVRPGSVYAAGSGLRRQAG